MYDEVGKRKNYGPDEESMTRKSFTFVYLVLVSLDFLTL